MILNLNDVTVIYKDNTKAVEGVSFSAVQGESIALIGENGAGKTTLLLAIVGILELSGGLIEADGILLTKKTLNEIRKKIGLVFQNPDDQLFMPYIYDDVAFGCRNFGMTEDETKNRVDETLNLLNISHLRNRSSLKLSEGEKRMAAIATVLAMQPSILMFDEPTAFLDHRARRTLIDTLQKLHHTKLIITHDMRFAEEVCNRVIILKNGRIAADGSKAILYDKELMQNCGLEAIHDTAEKNGG
ncbi:MAG: energy-coupling factor ABC transporter ATP-binding protein [Treponema sp.]|nr:energy-coupling factor ABC transporter ATP-binding protein [Treponema sp.]